jgi:hypothetical protein
VIAVLTVVAVIAGGQRPAPRPSPVPAPTVRPIVSPTTANPTAAIIGPTLSAPYFLRPFEYVLPAATTLQPLISGRPMLEGWADGPVVLGADRYGAEQNAAHPRGIVVAALDGPVVHPCPESGTGSRIVIRSAPQEFLDDLRGHAGVALSAVVPTRFDGRPAVVTTVVPGQSRCTFTDFHTGNDYVLLNLPSRLILVDVDGMTVLIDVWALTDDALAAWLPEADEVVQSIHFTGRPAAP